MLWGEGTNLRNNFFVDFGAVTVLHFFKGFVGDVLFQYESVMRGKGLDGFFVPAVALVAVDAVLNVVVQLTIELLLKKAVDLYYLILSDGEAKIFHEADGCDAYNFFGEVLKAEVFLNP